jgi:hypothetical protein
MKIKIISTALASITLFGSVHAQLSQAQLNGQDTNNIINPITTAVPFLLISPDARGGGMGDAGAATLNDVNASHWNLSKIVFNEKKTGVGLSYTPWLRSLVNDVNLAYVSVYSQISKRQAVSGTLRYFSLGKIDFTDINGNLIREAKPNEFAVDFGLAQKLSDHFSVGLTLRYVNSNLGQGVTLQGGVTTKAAQAGAADISTTYVKDKIKLGDKTGKLVLAGVISNIGNKVKYTDVSKKGDFIPINLRIGGNLIVDLDKYNTLGFVLDINKLLVPTPPLYDPITKQIIKGKDSNKAPIAGMLGSFNDAPGGAKEEFKEIIFCGGMEYWYDKLFAFRLGAFYENPTKGNRKYITVGAGIRYNVFGLDLSYLATSQQNPLKNTIRFTLSFDFAALKSSAAPTDGGTNNE